VRGGWELFPDHVPPDVADAVLGLLADPSPLVAELEGQGMTLLHSDPHFGNAVLLPDRLVLIDWGLAAAGPPTIDFVWFLDQSFSFLDASHDEVVELFLRAENGRVREEMLDAACLAQLVNTGWQVRHWHDSEERAAHRANLDWFVARARRFL
jgi:aminoglycoside phosphotransferase (APT) family kinase protein